MTKSELIAQVAQTTGLSKVTSKEVLETIMAQIATTLQKDSKITLFGLGTFKVIHRKKRIARNPRTNEPAVVKAHNTVKFQAAKSLKELLNETKNIF